MSQFKIEHVITLNRSTSQKSQTKMATKRRWSIDSTEGESRKVTPSTSVLHQTKASIQAPKVTRKVPTFEAEGNTKKNVQCWVFLP